MSKSLAWSASWIVACARRLGALAAQGVSPPSCLIAPAKWPDASANGKASYANWRASSADRGMLVCEVLRFSCEATMHIDESASFIAWPAHRVCEPAQFSRKVNRFVALRTRSDWESARFAAENRLRAPERNARRCNAASLHCILQNCNRLLAEADVSVARDFDQPGARAWHPGRRLAYRWRKWNLGRAGPREIECPITSSAVQWSMPRMLIA